MHRLFSRALTHTTLAVLLSLSCFSAYESHSLVKGSVYNNLSVYIDRRRRPRVYIASNNKTPGNIPMDIITSIPDSQNYIYIVHACSIHVHRINTREFPHHYLC